MMEQKDYEFICYRLEILQSVKHGSPKQLSLLEKYQVYGDAIFEDVSQIEKQKMLVEITEAMVSAKSSK